MKTYKRVVSILVCVAILCLSFSSCAGSTRAKPPEVAYKAADPYMQMSIEEARDGIYNGDGGPFGCVIVKDGDVVGKGHNRVLSQKDSTCHGEMEAIRAAEKGLGTYDLTGCVLYTTGGTVHDVSCREWVGKHPARILRVHARGQLRHRLSRCSDE
ncbi:MAG: nucleoside deaminase [Atopobiaceae bacterium]|nr:nucleoside deaminase [Atopobiaceae bacterium]